MLVENQRRNINDSNISDAVFVDFKNAFDMTDNTIKTSKLRNNQDEY